ncbi:uroporphyrinogen-III synthase [Sesbania bispinosa]|nr:uroporphyrinogen-III synthase [Sesbania bispinosa]
MSYEFLVRDIYTNNTKATHIMLRESDKVILPSKFGLESIRRKQLDRISLDYKRILICLLYILQIIKRRENPNKGLSKIGEPRGSMKKQPFRPTVESQPVVPQVEGSTSEPVKSQPQAAVVLSVPIEKIPRKRRLGRKPKIQTAEDIKPDRLLAETLAKEEEKAQK